MPYLNVELKNTTETILGPVIKGVVKDLVAKTGVINPRQIIFLGDSQSAVPLANTLGSDDTESLANAENILTVEVDHDYLTDSALAITGDYINQPILLLDPNLDFRIRPVYTLTELKLNFKIAYKSRSEALAWIKTLRLRVGKSRVTVTHQIEYSYIVPHAIVYLLDTIYSLTEAQAGYGRTLREYIDDYRKTRWISLNNQSGSRKEVAIAEKQNGIAGSFDFDTEPDKPEKNEDNGSWEINFSYSLFFHMPLAIDAKFPMTVHSQALPREFYDTAPAEGLDKELSVLNRSIAAMTNVGDDYKPSYSEPGVPIPFFDDWSTKAMPTNTIALIKTLIKMSSDDPTNLMNIKTGSGYWELTPDIVSYIEEDPNRLLYPGSSLFRITVFNGYSPIAPHRFYIDDLMVLRSKSPMDLRGEYRVILSLNYNIAAFVESSRVALIKYGSLVKDILSRLWPDYPGVELLPDGSYPIYLFEEHTVKAYRYVNNLYKGPTWNVKAVSLNFIGVN